ncbi:MAG: CCA tRNA nucleotidyltransferase [Peptostreptococcaceae bacterium]
MEIYLPQSVKFIIDKIYEEGYEAFIVGGCVRDSIIGITPNDYDITTNAKPKEVVNIFKNFKIIDNGIKHGTVGVIIEKEVYEITTYRIEGEYENNRRPKDVEFTKNIVEDLKRRDFTINAIAYNDRLGIVDKFNGIKDIKNKLVKTVGNPDERFNEDGLRLVRAIRFSSKLNFKIEDLTLKSIYKNVDIVKNISKERITQEFTKMILSDNPQDIVMLYKTGIFRSIGIYSYMKKEKYDEFEKKLEVLKACENDLLQRMAMLEYIIRINKIPSRSILKELMYSNKIKKECSEIVECMIIENKEMNSVDIKLLLNKIGYEVLMNSLELKKLYYTEQNLQYNENKKDILIIDKTIKNILDIEENKECYNIKNLNISGSEIQKMGYKGKVIGEKLNLLLNKVIENPSFNENEKLKKLLKT